MLYRIGNAPINLYPFPHLYVRDVFPADFYAELLRHLPASEALSPLSQVRPIGSDVYDKTRSVLVLTPEHVGKLAEPYRGFWERIARMLMSGNLANLLFGKFGQFLQNRFKDQNDLEFFDEALLVRDRQNYALGPHTDTPAKVFAFLFYLPADDLKSHLGTSIYVPKEPGFTCPGGPHYSPDRFERMMTMPYLPNSLFGFMKTANSFHGVEQVADADVGRNLLLYDVKVRTKPQAPVPLGGAKAEFKF